MYVCDARNSWTDLLSSSRKYVDAKTVNKKSNKKTR